MLAAASGVAAWEAAGSGDVAGTGVDGGAGLAGVCDDGVDGDGTFDGAGSVAEPDGAAAIVRAGSPAAPALFCGSVGATVRRSRVGDVCPSEEAVFEGVRRMASRVATRDGRIRAGGSVAARGDVRRTVVLALVFADAFAPAATRRRGFAAARRTGTGRTALRVGALVPCATAGDSGAASGGITGGSRNRT